MARTIHLHLSEEPPVLIAIGVAAGVVGGAILALLAVQVFGATGVGKARRLGRTLVEDAEREAEAVRREAHVEAREQAVKLRAEIDAELADRRQAVVKIEERVLAKEEDVERKLVDVARRDQGISDRETHLRALQDELKEVKRAQQAALERISGLTLTELIEDGRIHPARIEETYYQSKAELEEIVRQAGEQAVFEANCGPFHEELQKILGRLRFRTSYGQNVLKHTLEVVHLTGIMATELGASVRTAKRAAMLHDVGKAMTHEVEGSHALISAQLARRYGEPQGLVHAIEAPHYEVQPQTVEAVLVIAADAISASRPGARGESLEHYIKRLEALEELAAAKPGVEKVYALQAGREIRVIVSPGDVSDEEAALLSHEIAREIEDQLEYPGQVKVTVIRESRAIDVARNRGGANGGPDDESGLAQEAVQSDVA